MNAFQVSLCVAVVMNSCACEDCKKAPLGGRRVVFTLLLLSFYSSYILQYSKYMLFFIFSDLFFCFLFWLGFTSQIVHLHSWKKVVNHPMSHEMFVFSKSQDVISFHFSTLSVMLYSAHIQTSFSVIKDVSNVVKATFFLLHNQFFYSCWVKVSWGLVVKSTSSLKVLKWQTACPRVLLRHCVDAAVWFVCWVWLCSLGSVCFVGGLLCGAVCVSGAMKTRWNMSHKASVHACDSLLIYLSDRPQSTIIMI